MTNQDATGLTLGKLAVKAGFITKDQLKEGVSIHRRMKEMGISPKPLPEILQDKGWLDDDQVARLERARRKRAAKAAADADGARNIAGFELEREVGRGAMGVVWRARQVSMDRTVALKILPPGLAEDERFVERFLHEARAVARLNHPHIIAGIDVGESDGTYYFAMEYVNGPTVADLLQRGGHLDDRRAVRIAIQVADALDHAHKHDLVHRDVKPGNIMISQGKAKLCDLGLARVGDRGARGRMGTPNYISPEQAQGGQADIRSDLYSLGASLYHMVTGEVPFPGGSPDEVGRRHVEEAVMPPSKRNPDVDPGLEEIILRLMEKRPQDRYSTPADVRAALQEWLDGGGRPRAAARAPVRRGASARRRFRR